MGFPEGERESADQGGRLHLHYFLENYLKGILRLLLDVELVDFVPVFADGRHVLHPSFATHLID